MNNLTATLKIDQLRNINLSADYIAANTLSNAIDSLDNRLSDMHIEPTATKEIIVSTISSIISKFGGNN